MSALSPPSVSTIGLYFDHTISPDQNCLQGSDLETLELALHFPTYLAEFELDPVTPPLAISCDPKMVKKLNHNASERNRRQKMNDLYSSLGSLLPEADRTKKLSIPATVSQMLKYIPELQQQVMELIQKKEELLSTISSQAKETAREKQPKRIARSTVATVSASRLDDGEVVIQVSTSKVHETALSEILLNLEEDGLLLLNASSFESSGGRVSYTLHLQVLQQVEGSDHEKLECEILREKLMSLYDNREALYS
ncbi:Transcription factor ORG2 [Morella rubra]|uniref:Transcription factor ORG2 n=1 Tax=Morella rubra TaxID=262757 RepID=A0A6A1WBG0_9ROSI|nr:Transcription factor ORG2 [Morella rubra]KAB1222223.1 Transcription factor ORG2 [Morella rubra]